MATPKNDSIYSENTGDVNFQLYFNMIKNDTITWEVFLHLMKDIITFLDLAKSKKLIFDLLEELKGFKDRELEYVEKLKFDRINELEKSNDILRKENETLKKEHDELQKKLASIYISEESHVSYDNNKEFESKMEIMTDIKIEEFNINETIVKDEIFEEFNVENTEENIEINPVSVCLIPLSKSQLERYLNIKDSTTSSCEMCDNSFNSLKSLNEHIETTYDIQKKIQM